LHISKATIQTFRTISAQLKDKAKDLMERFLIPNPEEAATYSVPQKTLERPWSDDFLSCSFLIPNSPATAIAVLRISLTGKLLIFTPLLQFKGMPRISLAHLQWQRPSTLDSTLSTEFEESSLWPASYLAPKNLGLRRFCTFG